MTIAPHPEEYLPKIKEHVAGIQQAEGNALARAIACGQLLASAKEALNQINAKLPKSKHVSWGGWLEESLTEFKFKRSTADVYIRLYEERDLIKEKGCKSISEARAALPPLRTPPERKEEDEECDDDSPLSDKDREQVASEYISSRLIPELYDQLVSIFNDKQLFELYQMLGQRFAKAATAVANQPADAPQPKTTFPMAGLQPRQGEAPTARRA
jgi:hypothetical protein